MDGVWVLGMRYLDNISYDWNIQGIFLSEAEVAEAAHDGEFYAFVPLGRLPEQVARLDWILVGADAVAGG